ncbi:MAG: RagB/SusD family nutrient uptake outer membrane protein [Bacteroidales bacterium]|nr:RagB/SusD family nutrient uptake outer membrane protein [Bacteroidales bacterium]
MKKIYLIALVGLLAFGSCEEWLEVSPYGQKVVGNFYQTPADALQGLVAAYDVLQWSYYDHILQITEAASDNCFGGAGASDDQRYQVWDDFISYGFNNPHDECWGKYWTGIYRCNVLLQNLGDVSGWENEDNMSEERFTAEARFLRAYFYFDLVRMWGNVPLLSSVIDVNNLNVPPSPPEDVYAQIAEDLVYAIETLEAVPYQSIDPSEYGRVTKWAAEALLGRVFLYYTDYYEKPDLAGIVTRAEAAAYVDDVIDNSGYDLVPDFNNLWVQTLDGFVGEDNIETVFPIKYTYKGYGDANLHDGNNWQVMIGLRNQNISTYANGWGACTVNPALYHAYEAGDTRRDASILGWDELGLEFDESDQREYTGYNWRKFVPIWDTATDAHSTTELGGNYIIDNPDDKPEIRFAEVLLTGAELHLDDNAALAQQYFDRVRNRAFAGSAPAKSVSYENILEERRLELAFEGLRYWDVIRQDMATADQILDWNESDEYFSLAPYPVNFRPETNGLFEVPISQIELSQGTLIQNTGWPYEVEN